MKRTLTNFLMAVALAGPVVSHVAAQTNLAVADIPFAFTAENRVMPAGQYRVSELSWGSPVFSIADTRGHAINVRLGKSVTGNPEHPSLTFTCYGKEKDCVLAKVTPPNGDTAYALNDEAHKQGKAASVSIKLETH